MTIIGWIQILLYCAIIVAITPVLGGYMTRVFNGERTFLTPILRPVELALYGAAASTRNASSTGWPTRSPCCCSMSAAFSFSTG